jgi:hypothetical protein
MLTHIYILFSLNLDILPGICSKNCETTVKDQVISKCMTSNGVKERNTHYVPQGNNKTLFQTVLYSNGKIFIQYSLNSE